ncbi:hypothetical protein LTR94_036482, partial [Friedmanniomyces endolithicus]
PTTAAPTPPTTPIFWTGCRRPPRSGSPRPITATCGRCPLPRRTPPSPNRSRQRACMARPAHRVHGRNGRRCWRRPRQGWKDQASSRISCGSWARPPS